MKLLKDRARSVPTVWFDLVTFDKEWIKDKTMVSYYDPADNTIKPAVFDKDGKRVY